MKICCCIQEKISQEGAKKKKRKRGLAEWRGVKKKEKKRKKKKKKNLFIDPTKHPNQIKKKKIRHPGVGERRRRGKSGFSLSLFLFSPNNPRPKQMCLSSYENLKKWWARRGGEFFFFGITGEGFLTTQFCSLEKPRGLFLPRARAVCVVHACERERERKRERET